MAGYLSLVVVAHVPYLRYNGRDPVGEDVLHATIAEVLLPLLNTLHDLRDARVEAPIGVACSPVLLEQLADPVVQKHFVLWIEQWLRTVEAHRTRWQAEGQYHLLYLAQFYLEWGQTLATSFQARYQRNLVVALRELCEAGLIEPLLLPATNLQINQQVAENIVRAQIEVGMLNTARHLGQQPRGLWLGHSYRRGLEHVLRGVGLQYLITTESTGSDQGPGWLLGRRVAALFRSQQLDAQLASLEIGYPGDPLYRNPAPLHSLAEPEYRRNGMAGSVPVDWYDPYHAFQRAQEHASHFLRFARLQLNTQQDTLAPLLILGYCPQPGGLWFEAITWLRGVLEAAALQTDLTVIAPGEYLRRHPPRRMLQPAAFDGREALALEQQLAQAAHRLAALVAQIPDADRLHERLLSQAGRELLLACDDGWRSIVGGAERMRRHLELFDWLTSRALQADLDADERAELELVEDRHSVFPLLNYRVFEDS